MTIARIINGTAAEVRTDLTLEQVPPHKREHWRPIEGEQPAYSPQVETISGPTLIVEPTRVLRQWTVTRLPDADLVRRVKDEARRRILARYPEWMQSNMTARGVELQDVLRRVGSWTDGEQAEAYALMAAWDWIKSVRAASNTIEGLQPIPADYASDQRWPA